MKPPVKYIPHGDRNACKRLELAHGRRITGILETIMATGNQQQNLLRFVPYDGALMVAREFFGTRIVDIYAESGGAVEPSEITYDLIKIFVHIDMLNHEDWGSVWTGSTYISGDRVLRENVISAVACGIVVMATGEVVWSAVKEPYSETYDCNLLAEHSGTDWEGVYSLTDTAANANLVLSYYNELFSDAFLYEAELPTIENKWIKTKVQAGAIVFGTENYAITAVLTSGYSSVYTYEDGTLLDWTKYTYSNTSSSVWLTPPSIIDFGLSDKYSGSPLKFVSYATSAYKMPFIRYMELSSDGVTYEPRQYERGVQALIRHEYYGGGPYPAPGPTTDGPHRFYRMRYSPIVGFTWCLPDEQQTYKTWTLASESYSVLHNATQEVYLIRGLHRTLPTYASTINTAPYRGAQMSPASNTILFEHGNVYEQNYELADGFSWYLATAGGNFVDRYIDSVYNGSTTTVTSVETVRGLYNMCAVAGYNKSKWGNQHTDPINAAIKTIAAKAITYLGGVVYDTATLPLDIPANDETILNDVLEFETVDFKQSPGLLYCSPLFNIRVNCVPVKQKLVISQPGG